MSRKAQILGDIYNRLQHLRKEGHPPRDSIMNKALNYMNTYLKQLTGWRMDGRYDIDNTLAERSIRPMSVKRKNYLFYGFQEMPVVPVTFHTLLTTCHFKGNPLMKFLMAFVHELIKELTIYQNLILGVFR
ncbi:MAG: transposase [Bacilli bacterium]|nr:transposase [Bacilli bacterium]